MLEKPSLASPELQTEAALHFLVEGGIIFRILAEDTETAQLVLKEHLTAPDPTVNQDTSTVITRADNYFQAGDEGTLFVQDISDTYEAKEYHLRILHGSGPMEQIAPIDSVLSPSSKVEKAAVRGRTGPINQDQLRLLESGRNFETSGIATVYTYLPDA